MSERIDPAGEKISDDDASIAAALEEVSIPTLLLSMVHMTGDAGILDGPPECRQEVEDAYDERLQEALAGMVWSHPSIRSSWYRNSEGRVTILSPWRLVDYWRWTQKPSLNDYMIE